MTVRPPFPSDGVSAFAVRVRECVKASLVLGTRPSGGPRRRGALQDRLPARSSDFADLLNPSLSPGPRGTYLSLSLER